MPKMLPALPEAFGDLKDVFRSALFSTRGSSNPLNLPAVKSALVIMVDGLGWHQLRNFAGHAPFLSRQMDKRSKSYSGFPSTTASSLVSLATGLSPSDHGFIGYKIFDRETSQSINFLSGLQPSQAERYLHAENIWEMSDVNFFAITKPEYLGTGFTRATFPGGETRGFSDLEQRFEATSKLLSEKYPKVIYLYVPELDQAAHKFGVDSFQWLNLLELLDSLVKQLVSSLPKQIGVLLTADHGVVDVASEGHVYLDEAPGLKDVLLDVGGDPRATFLYLKNGYETSVVKANLESWLGGAASVYTLQELIAQGLYGSAVERLSNITPDLVVLAGRNRACYHRGFAKSTSLAMIGQHGGITDEEITIPVIRFAGYSSSLLVP